MKGNSTSQNLQCVPTLTAALKKPIGETPYANMYCQLISDLEAKGIEVVYTKALHCQIPSADGKFEYQAAYSNPIVCSFFDEKMVLLSFMCNPTEIFL